MSEFELNSRIIDHDGYKGTIKYIGKVASSKIKDDIWIGVEWDKVERGKHDGSCVTDDGMIHKYFDCKPGSGSFVKENKIMRGKSFAEALKERYVKLHAPTITDEDCNIPDAFVMTSKGYQKNIELVGEMKIRKWQQIDIVEKVVIRNECISHIGENISELAGHFKEIDLQENLFSEWEEIATLTIQIPNLESLLLHGNKFQNICQEIIPKASFNNLKLMALNSCNIKSWETIDVLETFLLSIEELYIASNDLNDIPEFKIDQAPKSSEYFRNLKVLDVSECQIDRWGKVLNFLLFPNLQELFLNNNPIKQILSLPKELSNCKLQKISLSSTGISDWCDIDALSTYSTVQQLRLSHLPLFSGRGASEVRPKVVARMKNLTFFNGSGISGRERWDAERMYLRSIIREINDLKISEDDPKIIDLHPRFNELKITYAEDLIPVKQLGEGVNLAADIINVTFRNLTFSSNGSLEPISKKIPSTVTIARLRMMVKQMIGLEIRRQQLSLRIYKDSPPVVLDDDQSTLLYYGALDGAEIFINESK